MEEYFVTGTVDCDASSLADIDVSIGFTPSAVEVYNPTTGAKLWWTEDMDDASGNLFNPNGTGLLKETTLSAGTSDKTKIAFTAFTTMIAGVTTAVAAAERAPYAGTLTKAKWGCFGLEVGINGTVDAAPNSTAFAFDTEAAAIASMVGVGASAAHAQMGYMTIQSATDSAWVGATSNIVDAADANFYSTDALQTVTTGGITPYSETTFTISSGTTPGGGRGFTIGTNANIQVVGTTLTYKAWR